jgi:hypothetical protein
MLDADFWLDQALMFRRQADHLRDSDEREELRALARICATIAVRIEQQATGG